MDKDGKIVVHGTGFDIVAVPESTTQSFADQPLGRFDETDTGGQTHE